MNAPKGCFIMYFAEAMPLVFNKIKLTFLSTKHLFYREFTHRNDNIVHVIVLVFIK